MELLSIRHVNVELHKVTKLSIKVIKPVYTSIVHCKFPSDLYSLKCSIFKTSYALKISFPAYEVSRCFWCSSHCCAWLHFLLYGGRSYQSFLLWLSFLCLVWELFFPTLDQKVILSIFFNNFKVCVSHLGLLVYLELIFAYIPQ